MDVRALAAIVLLALLAGAGLSPAAFIGGAAPPSAAPPTDPAAERLAGELLAAPDDAARTRLLAEHADVSRTALCAALLARGRALYSSGDRRAALTAWEVDGAIAQAADLERPLADALFRAAVARESLGDLARGEEDTARAEALFVKLGAQDGLARLWNHRGLTARRMVEFDEAEAYFRRSLEAFRATGAEKDAISAVLGNIGLVCLNRGDFACALDAEQRALEVDPRNSYAVHNIAVIHEEQGDDALALDAYLRSAALDHEDGDAVHEGTSLLEAGRMQMRLGQELPAQASFAAARAIFGKAEAPNELGLLEYALGEMDLDAGRAAAAVRHFETAVARHEAVDRLHAFYSLTSLSRAQLRAGQAAEALASARRALEIARQLGSLSFSSHVWLAIGEAQEALGDAGAAQEAYTEAMASIEAWRTRVAGDEASHERFFESWLRPYHRLLRRAVAAGRTDDALHIAELARARVLVDILQHGRQIGMRLLTPPEREQEAAAETAVRALEAQREVRAEGETGPDAALDARLDAARRELAATRTVLFNAHAELRLARGQADTVTAHDLAPLLADGSAAVAFTVTDDATYVQVLTAAPGSGAPAAPVAERIVTLPIGSREWRRRVGRFRDRLAHRDLDVGTDARALFADLLGPLRSELKSRRHVYLVPDGALWELPFAALQPVAGHDWIEDTALVTVPSLTALAAWRTRPATARPAGGYEALVVGQAEFGPSRAALPEVVRQTRTVAALYGARTLTLVGHDATEARVKAEAGRARILHFATHGVLDPASPLYSAVILAPEPAGSAENGRLEAREILDLELSADLAVLSACETARGRVGAGEGVIGLSWALSVAGVRNTVVSLWSVDAGPTTDLMAAFHRRVRRGEGYAEALRAAALTVRANPRTRHPFYWAPFVLIGDGLGAGGPAARADRSAP